MRQFSSGPVVKRSAGAALIALSLCPFAAGEAPAHPHHANPGAFVPAAVHPEAAPYAGQQNYGTQVRPFRYGWFGAEHFYPTQQAHKTYYNDVIRWSRWRRY